MCTKRTLTHISIDTTNKNITSSNNSNSNSNSNTTTIRNTMTKSTYTDRNHTLVQNNTTSNNTNNDDDSKQQPAAATTTSSTASSFKYIRESTSTASLTDRSDDTCSTTGSSTGSDCSDTEPTPKRVRSEGHLNEMANSNHSLQSNREAPSAPPPSAATLHPRVVEPDNEDGLELPDPAQDINPTDFLIQLVQVKWDVTLQTKKSFDLEGFFPQSSEEQMAAYTMQVVNAVRNNDLEQLKQLHGGGQRLDCFNRFGESLLNMACRRGFKDIVEYLLEQNNISLRIRDDCGRTPLHDACWNPNPLLDICEWIIQREPSLFLIADKRGFTPFMYARPQHYGIWRQFLFDNRHSLKVLSYDKDVSALVASKN